MIILDFLGNMKNPDPPKKITPSMIKLQSSSVKPVVRSSKSTSDLRNAPEAPEALNVRNSHPNVSQVDNVQLTKNQIKEQKKLEKKRLDEQKNLEKKRLAEQKKLEKRQLEKQKKRDRIAAQEQKKQENLRKKQERQTQSVQKPSERNRQVHKRTAPQPSSQSSVPNPNPVSSEPKPINRQGKVVPQTQAYSTNTLESSISRSSGPPPYAPPETVPNSSDDTGNTRFAPTNDTSSWDLISQHRQEISRPKVTKTVPKQTHLDLNYNVGNTKSKEDDSIA